MKSALLLNGSPRTKGNTSVLINWCNASLKENDWKVKRYDLYRMNVRGCAHCDACKKNLTKPGCVIKDEFLPVLDVITNTELLVIASPVYCWSVSGCMSSALDRFYSLFKGKQSLVAGKKVVGLFTAGGDEFEGMDLCVRMLKNLCAFGDAYYAGVIEAGNCKTPQELATRANLKQQIAELVLAL